MGAGSAGLEMGSDRPKPAGIFSARATGLSAAHSQASTLAMYADRACVGVRAEKTPSQHSTDHTEQFPLPNTRKRRRTVLQHRTRRMQKRIAMGRAWWSWVQWDMHTYMHSMDTRKRPIFSTRKFPVRNSVRVSWNQAPSLGFT